VSATVRVEVVFALPLAQEVATVDVPAGATVRDAIECSGLLERHAAIDLARVGIWGRRCRLEDAVREGDRIELYRPLTADPKEVRRRRAGKLKRRRTP
jgi:putative ubiquitin-RnfH superfamily antitoxin RatB of RatAB toxin-antitoxin module